MATFRPLTVGGVAESAAAVLAAASAKEEMRNGGMSRDDIDAGKRKWKLRKKK